MVRRRGGIASQNRTVQGAALSGHRSLVRRRGPTRHDLHRREAVHGSSHCLGLKVRLKRSLQETPEPLHSDRAKGCCPTPRPIGL